MIYQDRIKALYPIGNYSFGDNFHVTLKFIGEVYDDELSGIKACMDRVALGHSGFEVGLGGFGVFRRGNRGVIWAKVLDNRSLYRLSGDLELCLLRGGYVREDRSFRPHVTLGRNVLCDEAGFSGVFCDIIGFSVNSFCLMESRRVDGVLRYVPIYRVVFGGMRD
jgi:2'-5' RNA ligase